MKARRWACGVAAWTLLGAAPALPPARIDRHALVERHAIVFTTPDRHAPVMLGNGELGFTADITGLQTFPDAYAPTAPLLTMAQWAWHGFPNPHGYGARDGEVPVDVPGRGRQPFAYIADLDAAAKDPAIAWLRENPHRFSLARIALAMTHADGRPVALAELTDTRQRLDLWTGTLTSRFTLDGQPVTVVTRVAAPQDAVLVEVSSPLVASGRVGVDVRFPGVSHRINPDPSDWSHPSAHATRVTARAPGRLSVENRIDATRYGATVAAAGARVTLASATHDAPSTVRAEPVDARATDAAPGSTSFDKLRTNRGEKIGTSGNSGTDAACPAHTVTIRAPGRTTLTAAIAFAPGAAPTLAYPAAARRAERHWVDYWSRGAAIDLSATADPRARELERRIVLSQYLAAINEAGSVPPQEEGLFSNSWNGKFHLEMTGWHAAHFAAWGRPALTERTLAWYTAHLPDALAQGRRHGLDAAWWPKMAGPEGRNSPSPINPFIFWQQPNAILLAEDVYRAHPDRATLDRYAPVVEATARLLAGWPRRGTDGRYRLGPPIIPVQENHDPFTTRDPAFELEWFRWGLQVAQGWRERRGLPRDAGWDRVIAGMADMPVQRGLYAPVASEPGFWARTLSPACRGHAGAGCANRDHPSFLMSHGLIAGRADPAAMARTLAATQDAWDWSQVWGWDFPMVAMTAARLGDADGAVGWLLRDAPNNAWGPTGMTPRLHPDATGAMVRDADTYFPSNGSLLLATAMMAAGWRGSRGPTPGFPPAWHARAEGFVRME